VEGSVYNNNERYYTTAVYEIQGAKIVMGGIYGPPDSSDRFAYGVFNDFFSKVKETMQLYGTQIVILAGDWNLHLDREDVKPRTCKLVREYIEEIGLIDIGERDKLFTWTRPGRRKAKSRIDYVMVSDNVYSSKLSQTWLGLDHANLRVDLEINRDKSFKVRLKDWVLTTDRFKERGRRVITETLIDHVNDREQKERIRIEIGDKLPREIEKEITVNDRDEGITNAHVLMVIINRIESVQRKVQIEYSKERRMRLEGIKERLKRLIEKRQLVTEGSEEEEEVLIEIERVNQELKEDVEKIDEAGRVRVRNFELDKTGKNNAYTFQVVKERKSKKQIKKLRVGNEEVQEPGEIMIKLQQKYQGIVGQPYETEMELDEFLNKYEVEFDLINDGNWMENEFTPEEVLEAIKNATKNAAPGPSGRTPSLYAYIYSEIPLLFTKAINELIFVPKLIKAPVFKWLQHRNIVYIPKPERDPELIENLRPLSILEAFYKVMSRVMAYRLIKATVDTGARDQHGFVTGKSCQTALLPVIAGADDAAKKGRPLQLLAIDISSAFDTIHPPLIHKVMLKQNMPNIYSEALHNLTTGGTAAVRCNNNDGEIFKVETGSGQGDPPSAPRFTTGTDPLTRALDNVTKDFRYKFNGLTLPVSVFADDNMLPLSIRSMTDVEKIIEIFDDFYKISGLKLNFKKTEILAFNTDPDLLQAVEDRYGIKIVQSMTYLGIEIAGTYQETKRASYSKAVSKIQEKMQ
jgi:hypothetical protein